MARHRSISQGFRASLRRERRLTAFCQVSPQSNLSLTCNEAPMLFVTRWFGVTDSDAERNLAGEQSVIEEIVQKVLLLQANAAAQQHRPLRRGTHAKGVCARAQFEVFDVAVGRDRGLATRLAKGMFAKADVRSLSFSVDLTRNSTAVRDANVVRQDFSMQNASTLPINDARAFLATMKLLTASNPAVGFWSLPFSDKLRVLRTLVLAQLQARQRMKPYQQRRYWSTVPFRHGPIDVVKHSATPSPDNPARPLQRSRPNALQHEVIRHLEDDSKMSAFDWARPASASEGRRIDGRRRCRPVRGDSSRAPPAPRDRPAGAGEPARARRWLESACPCRAGPPRTRRRSASIPAPAPRRDGESRWRPRDRAGARDATRGRGAPLRCPARPGAPAAGNAHLRRRVATFAGDRPC